MAHNRSQQREGLISLSLSYLTYYGMLDAYDAHHSLQGREGRSCYKQAAPARPHPPATEVYDTVP